MGQVEIWMGRAGSGKSRRIAADIRTELERSPFGSKIIWLVPGDASYATERMLMKQVPTSIRCEVMTLQRLAERANQALHVTAGATPVNTTGKRLTLAHVYQKVAPQLQVLQRTYPSIVFLDAILEVFDEMSAHLVSLESVETALEVAATQLADTQDVLSLLSGHSLLGKLRDLCLLYVHWNVGLRELSLYNPSHLVHWVGSQIGRWEALQGATVFVDGFSEMTPRDLGALLDVAGAAAKTVVALSMDESWLRTMGTGKAAEVGFSLDGYSPSLLDTLNLVEKPGEVYAPQTLDLYRRVRDGCRQRDLSVSVIHLRDVDDLSGKTTALNALERHLYREEDSTPVDGHGISWAAAQNMHTEVNGVTQEISNLVHSQGYRYDDIVVLVPQVTDYSAYLRDSFAKRGVPNYMDDFPSFATHPLAKFVLAAVQVVEDGFATESVIRLLKTDFCSLSREDADWLETYLRQHEVNRARAWAQQSAWTYSENTRGTGDKVGRLQSEDHKADGLRRQVAAYLLPLAAELDGEFCSPQRFAHALWTLMEQVQAKRIVAKWMVNEEAMESPLEASLHEQAWQRMMGLLSDLTETTGDAQVHTSFLVQVVKSDIIHQSLSTIPAGVNEVLVTDIARARAFTAKVVFVMGVVDGAFPRRIHSHGLLSDEERIQFQRLFGQAIGYTVEERQVCQRSTVYSAVTRANERLYLTYPLSNADGKEIRPSAFLGKSRQLFSDNGAQDLFWTTNNHGDRSTLTPQTALEMAVSALRQGCDGAEVPSDLSSVYRWFTENTQRYAQLSFAMRGLFHQTKAGRIFPEVARAIYGSPMKMNVYQLESFAACPYMHFAKHGLRLREEVTPDITAAARGTLLHDVLLEFVRKQMGDVPSWRALTDEAAVTSVGEVFEQTLERPESAAWLRKHTRRQLAMEVLSVLEHAAIVLTRHARHGLFAPVAMELSFGMDGPESLPGYDIEVDDGITVSLRGRIDRVDGARDGDLSAFRIVDYKSSEMDIDLNEVHHGLRLQLPIYAAVIEHHSVQLFGQATLPAAMIYIPIVRKTTPRLAPSPAGSAQEESLKKMRAKGLMVHHPQWITWMDERLTPGGESELFPKVYKNDGNLYKNAPILSDSDWRRLVNRALGHVSDFAKRIQSGDIEIAPYQLGPQDQACTFCPYGTVCQIDKRWDTRPVRYLDKYKKEELQNIWAGTVQEVKV
jgi:ATP-dependent helicase/nuclease subunit B